MIQLNDITFDFNKISKEELINQLNKFGVVALPNFVSQEVLNSLLDEYEKLLFDKNEKYTKNLQYSIGTGNIILLNYLDKSKYPNTLSMFSSNYMNEISEMYLKSKVNLNSEIYVVKDIVGSKHHANDLHFDVTPTFKFFIYLTDTTKENGAFSCVPASHKKAEKIRDELGDKISYENRELSRQLPVTEEEVISIEGKAGTLIIFDTDVFHRTGHVSLGERKVMRGHTRKAINKVVIENQSFLNRFKNRLFGK
jgi:ectoine hydroxylase-related dioxygenase (phytanoyl-CoA dioxygenase family)